MKNALDVWWPLKGKVIFVFQDHFKAVQTEGSIGGPNFKRRFFDRK